MRFTKLSQQEAQNPVFIKLHIYRLFVIQGYKFDINSVRVHSCWENTQQILIRFLPVSAHLGSYQGIEFTRQEVTKVKWSISKP
jgi:hypothetical protein